MHWAASYLHIPFVDRGLTHDGCDCWGLYRLIMLEQKRIELPAWPDIPAGADAEKLDRILSEAEAPQWENVQTGQEREFDVVLMRGVIRVEDTKHMAPIHIGCVTSPNQLIQIERGSGVTIGNYKSHIKIRRRIQAFYRYIGT